LASTVAIAASGPGSLPCKSHDRPTGCEPSWDYRGICPSQRKMKRGAVGAAN